MAPTATRDCRAFPVRRLRERLEVSPGQEERRHAGGHVEIDGPTRTGASSRRPHDRGARSASRQNMAYSDQLVAATMPSDTSVSMVDVRAGHCGPPPCRTAMRPSVSTGAARAMSSHCQPGKRKRRHEREGDREVAQGHEDDSRDNQPPTEEPHTSVGLVSGSSSGELSESVAAVYPTDSISSITSPIDISAA